MTTRDAWDPGQYDRFAAERRQPFVDLLALCRPVPGGTIVDLGCGPGGLTVELHRALGAAHTTGIDLSAAMLAEARERWEEEYGDPARLLRPEEPRKRQHQRRSD